MKKVLVAIDNEQVIEKIQSTNKYDCYNQDISYMEGVIEYLLKHKVDCIITKDTLSGDMDKKTYIEKIREITNAKIVLIAQEVDMEYKGFLLAHGVDTIFEGSATYAQILSGIELENKFVMMQTNNKSNNTEEDKQSINVITKQMIAVFGTSGAGKSYFSSVLSNVLSKKYKFNTLLIDMDVQNAATDIYNNLPNQRGMLEGFMENFDDNKYNLDAMPNPICIKENSHLAYLTNSIGIYDCQANLSSKHYEEIFQYANNSYDITIVDLPSSPFFDVVYYSLIKAQKVFFVINPNYISLRQAIKYLDLMINTWHIGKDKIYLVVNKIASRSLSINQIEAMIKGFKVDCQIYYTEDVEGIVNGYMELDINRIKPTSAIDKISEIFELSCSNNAKISIHMMLQQKLQKMIGAIQ